MPHPNISVPEWANPDATYDVQIPAQGEYVTIYISTHLDRSLLLLGSKAFEILEMDRFGADDLIVSEILPVVVEDEETEEPYYETLQEIVKRGHRTLAEFIEVHFHAIRSFCSIDGHSDHAFVDCEDQKALATNKELRGFLSPPCDVLVHPPVMLDVPFFLGLGATAVAIHSARLKGTVGAAIPGHALRLVADGLETRSTAIRLGRNVGHYEVLECVRLGEQAFPLLIHSNHKSEPSVWFWMPPKSRRNKR